MPPSDPTALTPEAFAEHFSRASRSLWALAAGLLGDRTEAEDTVQEAALLAYQRRAQFRPGTNFAGWLATFVRHVANNTGRKRTRRATTPVDPEIFEPLADESTPEPARPVIDDRGELALDASEFDDRVMAALLELPPDARACLLLRVLLDHTYAEIGAILSLPEGTVASHVHRARAALRERLEPLTPAKAEGMQ